MVTRSIESFDQNQDDAKYEEGAIRLAAWAHVEIVRLQPFEDANKRTARALMSSILVRLGLRPISIDACRSEYWDVVEVWLDSKSLQPLLDLLQRLASEQI